MTTTTYAVTGMTCGHCSHAVAEELQHLDGVQDVKVELNPSGQSAVTVTSQAPLTLAAVTAALAQAGDYELVG